MRVVLLVVQALALAAVVAGVFLLAGTGWALIAAGVATAAVVEVRT